MPTIHKMPKDDEFEELSVVGSSAFPLIALRQQSSRTQEEAAMPSITHRPEGKILEGETDAESLKEPFATYFMMLRAGENLQETLDAVVEEHQERDACLSTASIDYRAAALKAMLDRWQNQAKGSEVDERLKGIGKQLQMQRTKGKMSRQMLSHLSSVPRDVIFCLEHGMLSCEEVDKYLPVLAKCLVLERR